MRRRQKNKVFQGLGEQEINKNPKRNRERNLTNPGTEKQHKQTKTKRRPEKSKKKQKPKRPRKKKE